MKAFAAPCVTAWLGSGVSGEHRSFSKHSTGFAMCFIQDCDWTARHTEDWTAPVDKETTCQECYRKMPVGSPMYHVHQQEYDECQVCEDADLDMCECDKPDFGETFEYVRCADCSKFLQAVEAAEIEAGCKQYEATPLLTDMREAIHEGGRREAKKYWKKALQMFPEMKPYLGWLWRKTF